MKTECHKFIIFLYLETLLVWVDKENSIEFSFNSCILLIYISFTIYFYFQSPIHSNLSSYCMSNL